MPAYYTPSQDYINAQIESAKRLSTTVAGVISETASIAAEAMTKKNKEFNKKPGA